MRPWRFARRSWGSIWCSGWRNGFVPAVMAAEIRFPGRLDRPVHYRDRAGRAHQTAPSAVDHSRPLWPVASHAPGAVRGQPRITSRRGDSGLDVVTGFSPAEPRMFGMDRLEHDLRYEMADEFVSIAKRLWQSEQNLTYDGRFWRLEDAFVRPRPRYGRPILVSATGSPARLLLRRAALRSRVYYKSGGRQCRSCHRGAACAYGQAQGRSTRLRS